MNYQETTEYLFNSYPVFEHVGGAAYKEGLSNTHLLDNHFGHPHTAYPTIHIAGTNGKGSCSHSIAAILQKAGYKVGLYTSPHLVDFRERIRVNGQCISEQRVIDFVAEGRAFFETLHPSFFELTTALAFLYFKEQAVDVAVIEVGLGGRLDCTNIITPLLSVITNISFDHTQFLGHTLSQIATEKAGIIKDGVPVVIGETTAETRPVFTEHATIHHCPIVFAEDHPEVLRSEDATTGRRYITHSYGSLRGQLRGDYQERNTNTVLTAINLLRQMYAEGESPLAISDTHVKEGLNDVCASTGLMGRWQILHERPLTLCDTGHNLAGWQYLAPQIIAQPCHTRRIVFGMVDDKDIDGVLSILPQAKDRPTVYYWTQASTKRAFPVSQLALKASEHGLQGRQYSSVSEAYLAAQRDASPDDFIFVGGSSYIVADLLGLNNL